MPRFAVHIKSLSEDMLNKWIEGQQKQLEIMRPDSSMRQPVVDFLNELIKERQFRQGIIKPGDICQSPHGGLVRVQLLELYPLKPNVWWAWVEHLQNDYAGHKKGDANGYFTAHLTHVPKETP